MRRANRDSQGGGGKRLKLDPFSQKMELGKIESISLQNFMCHDNFTFKFGSRMNFIIGQNGSGKSAILTGLMLALGGKSKATGRFSNIKGFIKNGKQKAKIEVILYNTGPFSYKPEKYGDKICVIREFTIEGANSYKLKSQAGKIISNQKEELINVLNAMDIQIENPIQILTQETSRNFLVSKNATGENLYEMFFKGTGLHKLEEHYHEAKAAKSEAFKELERKKQALPSMKEDLKKWKKLLVCSEKVTDYKNELLWAGVIAFEKKLEMKQIEYKKVENQININKREVEKCKGAIEAKEKELEGYNKKRSESSAQLSDYRNAVQKINGEREECTAELRKYRGSLDLHKNEERKIVYEIQSLEARIRENQQKTQIDVREEENKRQAEIKQLQETNEKITFELENLNRQRRAQFEEQTQLKQQMDNVVAEMNSIGYNKRKIEENINRAKMAMKNRVNIWGDYTQNVLNEINARKREFRKPPRGPIGMYLEVKDPNWSQAIEKCISPNLLFSYCVDNHQDDKLLKEILRKHCGNRKLPSTIVCSYSNTVHDVSQFKATTPFPTVFDVLNIKDVQVANALIDHVKIESKILIKDTQTGQDFMLENPKNCLAAYIMNCDQICLNPYRYYSEANPNRNSLLSSVRQNAINELVENFNKATADLQSKDDEKNQLQRKLDSIPNVERKLNQQIVRLSSIQKDNLEKLKDLECVKEPEDVYCLEEDLQGLKQEYGNKQIEIETCEQEVAKYSEKMEKFEEELREHKELLCRKKEEYRELGVAIQNCSQELEFLQTGKNKYTKEATVSEKLLQSVEAELKVCQDITEDATRKALDVCPRIDTKREMAEIERQLAETSKVVQESSNCDRNEMLQKYNEKRTVLIEAEVELKKRENYISRLDGMLKVRLQVFKDMAHTHRQMVKLSFVNTLSGNGYAGSCTFDVNNRVLKLEVAPKTGQTAQKNHSTLSGGERSYVTLSFLLALWDQTHMPFRVLDEYDVFMDSSNRKLSVDLLISKAEKMAETQFIFLSPLDLPTSDWPKDCVKIHKMIPPKRDDGSGPSSTS